MEKIHPTTADVTRENIERLIELFPSVATETIDDNGNAHADIDLDALRDLIGVTVEGQRERYQFTWPGKRAAKEKARRSIDKTMRPEPGKSVNWDTTENLYIEGDNLDALKILRSTYAGKVKLIYIDPPYNTGHDFVYDDSFSQTRAEYDAESGDFDEDGGRLVANLESNGRFHSDWCSMMYPRLVVARDLLADDGVIFISIDDNEYSSLQKICDEIFGARGFIANCIWQKRTSPEARKEISAGHEYILVYAKKLGMLGDIIGLRALTDEDAKSYSNPDDDPKGPWASTDFTAPGYRPNQMYEIVTPSGNVVKPPEGRCWKNVESVYQGMLARNELWFGSRGDGVPRQKVYLADRDGRSTWTWWPNSEVGHTQEGTKELGDLLGRGVFDFPKPVRLLKRILEIGTHNDSLVLDFFSGSATMAHAVMQKNAEDGGSRRFILVQIPEETTGEYVNLCEVGEERIRRAGVKIVAEVEEGNRQLKLGEDPKPVPDVGFRVLRIDSSSFVDTYAAPDAYEQEQLALFEDNVKPDRSALDLLFQVLPSFRIPYSASIEEIEVCGKRVFDVNHGQLMACFDTSVGADCIEEIAKKRPVYAVFRDASMADDATEANFEELFKTFSPDTVRKVI